MVDTTQAGIPDGGAAKIVDPADRFEVTAYYSPNDAQPVIEIDTTEGLGEVRVYINDGQIFAKDPNEPDEVLVDLPERIERLIMEGYTQREARLILLVQDYAEKTPHFGKRYRNGGYSLKDIVGILAPQVEILPAGLTNGTPRHDFRPGEEPA